MPVLLGGLQLACGEPANIATPEAVLDSLEVVEAQGNLLMAIADGVQVARDEEAVIAEVAINLEQRFEPVGCARLTALEYGHAMTFEDCAGPRGLAHVAGTLLFDFWFVDSVVWLRPAWSNLTVNETTLADGDSQGLVGVSPDGHMLDLSTSGSAVGPHGNEVIHNGDYQLTLGVSTQCYSLVGTWAPTPAYETGVRRTTMANVMRCANQCPIGTVSRVFENDATVTVTLDGSPAARWESTTGRSGTIDVGCE